MPFLIRTQKQLVYSKRLIAPLVSLFTKEKIMKDIFNTVFSRNNLNPWLAFFSNNYFSKNLFFFFKNLLYFRFGLITNQATLSYNYHLVNTLHESVALFKDVRLLSVPHVGGLNPRVLTTIPTVSFSFHKDTYNTLIFYIFTLLLTPYVSSLNEFDLKHSYVILPNHFQLYLFLNLFYFRINNF